jgi:hypothetical protein
MEMDCDWEVPAAYCIVCRRPLSSHRMSRDCSGKGDGVRIPLPVVLVYSEEHNPYLPSARNAEEVQ